MINAQQAKDLLENIAKEKPERWVAAVQTLIVDGIEAREAVIADLRVTQGRLEKLLGAVKAIYHDVRALQGATPTSAETVGGSPPTNGASHAAAAPAGAPTPTAAPPPSGSVRIAADGSPLSPEEAAREAEMDAAGAAAEGRPTP